MYEWPKLMEQNWPSQALGYGNLVREIEQHSQSDDINGLKNRNPYQMVNRLVLIRVC